MSHPNFFSVVEAARVLRIGRTAAYEQSKVYRATQGAAGLPVVKMGGRLLVPRHQLELLAGGPLSEPEAPPEPTHRKKRARTPGGAQPALFEEAGPRAEVRYDAARRARRARRRRPWHTGSPSP